MEDYLTKLPCKYRKSLCQLRLSSHVLPIEQGRYRHVNRNERYCLLCNEDKIGDEFHFILECKALVDLRKKFIPKYYYNRPNVLKFNQLMSSDKISLLLNVAKFTKEGFVLYK